MEQLQTYETPDETKLFTDIQQELSDLKTEILEQDIETKKEWFGDFLKKWINITEFPKASWVGKFLRTFRYYKDIKNIAIEKNIPLNYFFWLKMIEGEGDPSTINTADGWAGISQIQPDTFKQFGKDNLGKDYKIFSDDPKYSYYDYDNLTKKLGKNRKEANKIIADVLVKIKKEWWYPALIALDDRFNPNIALEFSAEYLLHCKTYVNTKWFTNESWDVYKNNEKFDFEWMLALNWYNKWPVYFDVDVLWTHLQNLKTRVDQYDFYSQRLTVLLKKWYSYEEILLNIKKEEKDWQRIGKKEEKRNIPDIHFPFKSPEIQKEKITLNFLNKSQDQLWNVYKTTLPTDVTSIAYFKEIYSLLPGKELQFTDATGQKIETTELLRLKKWDILYIKEKI